MADPVKLFQISPKHAKGQGFNIVTENVTAIHLEDRKSVV